MNFSELKTQRVDPHFFEPNPVRPVLITEASAGGACSVEFPCTNNMILVRGLDKNKPAMRWLRNSKCADGAVIVESGGNYSVHAFELKSNLTLEEWVKAKLQLEGIIANSLAALAIIEAPRPEKLICHISYTRDSVDSGTANPVLLKNPIGKERSIASISEWRSSIIDILGFSDVEVRKLPRTFGATVVADPS